MLENQPNSRINGCNDNIIILDDNKFFNRILKFYEILKIQLLDKTHFATWIFGSFNDNINDLFQISL